MFIKATQTKLLVSIQNCSHCLIVKLIIVPTRGENQKREIKKKIENV